MGRGRPAYKLPGGWALFYGLGPEEKQRLMRALDSHPVPDGLCGHLDPENSEQRQALVEWREKVARTVAAVEKDGDLLWEWEFELEATAVKKVVVVAIDEDEARDLIDEGAYEADEDWEILDVENVSLLGRLDLADLEPEGSP